MKRNQFTFYRSYYEAIQHLPRRAQADVLLAIAAYALDETEPKLTGAALSAFILVRPTLDSGRLKAESGRRGGSKREANRKQTASKLEANGKQTGSEKEGEIEREVEGEVEIEIENECLRNSSPDGEEQRTPTGAVEDYLRERARLNLSPGERDELRAFSGAMGEAVCKRAVDEALEHGKAAWPYIRAILRDKQARGVQCLADWEMLETGRPAARGVQRPGSMAGKDFQPSAERIRENADWLDGFLAEQGVTFERGPDCG